MKRVQGPALRAVDVAIHQPQLLYGRYFSLIRIQNGSHGRYTQLSGPRIVREIQDFQTRVVHQSDEQVLEAHLVDAVVPEVEYGDGGVDLHRQCVRSGVVPIGTMRLGKM